MEQWRAVYGDVYSGVMFTPDASAGWGRISGVEQQLYRAPIPLEEMRRWQAATVESAMGSSTRGGCWRSVWVLGCCWLSWLRGVWSIGDGFLGADDSRRCRRRWPSSRGVIGCGCRCSPPMWQRVAGGPFRCGGPQLGGPVLPVGVSAGGGGAGDAVAGPGGALFIGDVRNLSLLRRSPRGWCVLMMPTATALLRWCRSGSVGRSLPSRSCCWRRVLCGPLPDYLPDIAAVDVQLKRMHAVNELSGYRYEVVLRKAPVSVRSLAHVSSEPWGRFGSLAGLGEYLQSQQLPELRVTGVPHAGIGPDVALADALGRPVIGWWSLSCVACHGDGTT